MLDLTGDNGVIGLSVAERLETDFLSNSGLNDFLPESFALATSGLPSYWIEPDFWRANCFLLRDELGVSFDEFSEEI